MDEEGLAKSTVMKQLRDMQGQMQEVLEDLETERESRNKAEKQKRDLNEVILKMITLIIWASTRQNLSSGFLKKQGSNQSPQLQRLARNLKYRW